MSRVRDIADNSAVFADGISTADITEGSNLFFTNTRADARITLKMIDEDNMSSDSAAHMPSQQSVKAYVDTEVAGLVSSAPGTLDTLNELAAALGDDANFSTTVTNSIATKLPIAGGTMTGALNVGNDVYFSGQLGLGSSSAQSPECQIFVAGDNTSNISDSDSLFDKNHDAFIKLENESNTSGVETGIILRAKQSGAGVWAIYAKQTSNYNGDLIFRGRNASSANSEVLRLTSSGNVLVGKTATNFATAGTEINPNGRVYATFSGGGPLQLNRLSNHGDIIELHKDGTEVGSIGIESSGFYVDGEGSHAGLKLFASAIGPRQNRADVDATIDLGWTGGKFKDIYASGTVYATPGGNDGSSANYAANSANEILNNYGYKPSGLYWIREPNTGTPKQIYCDMETDGGGWMLWLEYNTSTNSMHNQSTARANLGRSYNNNYSKYEVMVDASYVNMVNRRSLRGVWELDSNGAIRSNGFRNWGEVRLPEQVGDQFDPAQDQYYNMGATGEYIARDEYFNINGASGWTSIGTGSQYVYIREPNPAVKPGTMRSYGGINYVWDYDGTQYGWWIHESSYAVPMFNTVVQNGGFQVSYDGGRRDAMEPNNTTGQNSYVNVSNGNNGPSIMGIGSGVLVGEFSIMFNLGYSWGWSEMYIQDAIRSHNNMQAGGSPASSGGDQFHYSNNSSNNQGYYVYKTSDGVTRATASGLTPYSFGNYYTLTRRRDGNLYVRTPGANIYNPGTFFGPMKFFTGAQSPHSAQILNVISAGRNSALTASNEQAQTTLRH